MADWSAAQYSKFKMERTLPAIDLVNAIPCGNVRSVLDIGCGIGNSTAVLAKRFPNAQITGADNSEDMLAAARRENPGISFLKLDAETELDGIKERFDVVFSNARIQWIPNHRALLKSMFSLLRDGGVLAIQIPQQSKHPVHKILQSLSESEKWCDKLTEKGSIIILRKMNITTRYLNLRSSLESGRRHTFSRCRRTRALWNGIRVRG